MNRVWTAFVAVFLFVLSASAWAQGTPQQCGATVAGHLSMYVGNNSCLSDAGGPTSANGTPPNSTNAGTRPSGVGIVNSGQGIALYSGYSSAAYSRLLMGFDGSGNVLLTVGTVGGSTPTCNWNINGVTSVCGTDGFMDKAASNATLPTARVNLFPTPTLGNCLVGTGTDWASTGCGSAGMNADASNAVLPTARTNLGLGTLQSSQAATGTITVPEDPYLARALNSLTITSNDINSAGAPGGRQGVSAFAVENNVGGLAFDGIPIGTLSALNLSTPISNTWDSFAVAGWQYAYANVATGADKGALVGNNPQVVLAASGTGPWHSLVGEEVDVANLGAVNHIVGLDITKTDADTTQGLVRDTALVIGSAPGSSKWGRGIDFSTFNGIFPLSAGATLIHADSGTVTNGIDLSSLTISNRAMLWGSSFLGGDGSGYFVTTTGSEATFISTGAHESSITIDNQAGGNASSIYFFDAGAAKFQLTKNAGNTFSIFDISNSANALTVTSAGAMTVGETSKTLNLVGAIQNNGSLLISPTAPTIASGGCTTGSAQSISASNGTAAFAITLGGATCGSTIVLTLPAAAHGWVCDAHDITTPATNVVEQTTGGSTTSVTLTNFVRTTGVAGNFTAADVLATKCVAY